MLKLGFVRLRESEFAELLKTAWEKCLEKGFSEPVFGSSFFKGFSKGLLKEKVSKSPQWIQNPERIGLPSTKRLPEDGSSPEQNPLTIPRGV